VPDRRFLRRYGAQPLRLLALLACFALAGYAVWHVPTGTLPRMAIWFGAAIVAHDLVLFPAYALADRVLGLLARTRRVPLVNYVRTPALGSALLLVLFLPGIIRQGARTYKVATGLTQQPFLGRWLLLTAAMFAISAALYAVRLHRATAPRRAARRALRATIGPTERILAVAYSPGTDVPAATATTHALWLRHPAPPRWHRLGWEDLADLTPDGTTLHVTPLSGTPTPAPDGPAAATVAGDPARRTGSAATAVMVDDPGRLAALGLDRIAATMVLTRFVPLGPGTRAEVVLRRRPATNELVWRVHLDPGTDPTDPGTRQHLDEALDSLRHQLGLDVPSTRVEPEPQT
jgi:hypothetical protein